MSFNRSDGYGFQKQQQITTGYEIAYPGSNQKNNSQNNDYDDYFYSIELRQQSKFFLNDKLETQNKQSQRISRKSDDFPVPRRKQLESIIQGIDYKQISRVPTSRAAPGFRQERKGTQQQSMNREYLDYSNGIASSQQSVTIKPSLLIAEEPKLGTQDQNLGYVLPFDFQKLIDFSPQLERIMEYKIIHAPERA